MVKEDIEGPAEFLEAEGGGGEGEETTEGSSYSKEKLRQYQLNRLKYYYAVIECDSKGILNNAYFTPNYFVIALRISLMLGTAEHIYEQCDGLEYEHSGGKLDLR